MKGLREFIEAFWFLLLVSALLFCLAYLMVATLTGRPICGAVAVLAVAVLCAAGISLVQDPRI